MATAGSITLGQVAERTVSLAITCSRCDRAGRYEVGTLIARHGPDVGSPLLLNKLSAECPTEDEHYRPRLAMARSVNSPNISRPSHFRPEIL